jgi:hypothetical protein
MQEEFCISSYLKRHKKIRETIFSQYDLKLKLRISDYQINKLENGKIDFMPYPYNYYITKQYIELIDKSDIDKIDQNLFKTEDTLLEKNKNDSLKNNNKFIQLKFFLDRISTWIRKI